MSKKLLFVGWITFAILLFFYSFTQVDLGLTLTEVSFWQYIQKFFQDIGYLNRPASTFIFLFIVFFLFLLYLLTLKLLKEQKLNRVDVWKIILVVSGVLFFSYNAFSHDFFNYIFDAKIITAYHENPYDHKALDYPGDPMLGFMHWTHRTYPYGPFWLFLTVPLSFLGSSFLLLTIYLFKALMFGSFIGTVYFMEKILNKIKLVNSSFGIAFFALNPLILIESLVSAHNDIVMMFFIVLSFYLLITSSFKMNFLSILAFAVSIGIKYVTAFLIPIYFALIIKKEKIREILHIALVLMLIAVLVATIRTNFQPWYLIYPLTFAAFLSNKFYVFIPSLMLSITGLISYLPLLRLGVWDKDFPEITSRINEYGLIFTLFITLVYFLLKYIFSDKYHASS